MIKINDIVLYKTPEGNIEVAITEIKENKARIIWNESIYINGYKHAIGKESIVLLSMLKEK